LKLLNSWTKIDRDEALYLLSSNFSANDIYSKIQTKKHIKTLQTIRLYAIKILFADSDKNLELILLQLVQALRYEKYDAEGYDSPLMEYLIERATKNISIATLFYWYIKVN
jgi:phosphatidylinositol 3-kinase